MAQHGPACAPRIPYYPLSPSCNPCQRAGLGGFRAGGEMEMGCFQISLRHLFPLSLMRRGIKIDMKVIRGETAPPPWGLDSSPQPQHRCGWGDHLGELFSSGPPGPFASPAPVWVSAAHWCFKMSPWILATLSGLVPMSCPTSGWCFRSGAARSTSMGTCSPYVSLDSVPSRFWGELAPSWVSQVVLLPPASHSAATSASSLFPPGW